MDPSVTSAPFLFWSDSHPMPSIAQLATPKELQVGRQIKATDNFWARFYSRQGSASVGCSYERK